MKVETKTKARTIVTGRKGAKAKVKATVKSKDRK